MGTDNRSNWQQRYYATLEELEQKERDWQQAEDVLRRAISRLTLAAEGQDEALDKQLAELRLAIRNGAAHEAVKVQIESLSRALAELETHPSASSRPGSGGMDAPGLTLNQLLARIQWPEPLERQVKVLQKRLQKLHRQEDIAEHIGDFAALIRDSIRLLSQQQDGEDKGEQTTDTRGGLLGRLFSARRDDRDLGVRFGRELLDYLMDHLHLEGARQERIEALREAARKADGERGLHRLADELAIFLSEQQDRRESLPDAPAAPSGGEDRPAPNEVLLQLLERLVLPQEYQPQAEQIKKKLEQDPATQSWRAALSETADLVTTMRTHIQQEKLELEAFLGQVTERLDELDKHLQGDDHTGRSTLESTRALDASVRAEVEGISESVRTSRDVVQLKQSVHTRLDAIARHMNSFMIEEEARQKKRQAEVDALTERLHLLENETNALQRRVAEERAQAFTDALTGVPNRMALEDRVEQEVARSRRFGTPLSLAVLDVDHFKKINDTYGHLAGDKVLRTLAEKLSQNIRETDFLARYGGEEFVVLMPGAEPDAALGVADKLRQVIEECGFHFRNTPVPVTISCGVSGLREGEDAEAVFERADAALYRAKEGGRNRCEAG